MSRTHYVILKSIDKKEQKNN